MPMPPQQPQQPQQGGSGFSDLIANIFQQLGMLQQVVGKVSPEKAKAFQALQGQFQSAVESLQGEDEGQEMSPKPEGVASPEAGAAEVEPM